MGIDAARALTTINKGCSSIEIPLKETTKPYGTLHPREVKNNTNKVGNSKTHDYPEDKDPFSENIPTKPLDCNTRSLNPFDDDKDDSETDSSSGSPYPSGKNPFSENDGDNHQIITKSTQKTPSVMMKTILKLIHSQKLMLICLLLLKLNLLISRTHSGLICNSILKILFFLKK